MTEIVVVEKVCRDQAVSLAAAKGMMRLIERGFSRYGHPWDLPAIAGMENGVCVGLLLVKHDEVENTANVSLAWCDSSQPLLLTRLLTRLRRWCGEKGIGEVFFTYHDENDDMAKAAKAVRAEPYSHTYRVFL